MRPLLAIVGIAVVIAAMIRLNVRLYSAVDRTSFRGMIPQITRQIFVRELSGSWILDILALGIGLLAVIYAGSLA
jgi:hypothetical protein